LSTHSSPALTPDILKLIERCRNGDLTAFDEIVALHQNRIYNLCFWSLGDADEAADATQETFIRAWRAMAKFRGESAFATWLHRIALNARTMLHDAVVALPCPFLPFLPTKMRNHPALTHPTRLWVRSDCGAARATLGGAARPGSTTRKSSHGSGALRY
jgi:hypothetical protein